jgi:hypothetical protein
MDGERDRHGAVIQPDAKGATMPYAWFIYRHGFTGETTVRMPSLKMRRI